MNRTSIDRRVFGAALAGARSALTAIFLVVNPLLAAAVQAAGDNTIAVVEEAPLRAHLAFLSFDLLEGRGTGQRGGDLTVAYLESQALAIGLKPANGKSYRQSVKLTGVRSLTNESSVHLEAGGKPLNLAFGNDWVWASDDAKPVRNFDAELIFVGYGVTAPEEDWDDYKGLDCKGKLLVMMLNDPQPTAEAPHRFGGRAMTYYGRWTYKNEEAKRRGAAGVLLIHTNRSAGFGWSVVKNSMVSETFQLTLGPAGIGLEAWLTEASARSLFAAAGQDLDALRSAAERKDFRPVVFAARLSGEARSAVRQVEQFNVAGLVPGTDPTLKDEVVIYSTHWDHLGKGEGMKGDDIYNGAVDNASGTAGLLAMARAAVAMPARRTQMFLWTAAEEQELLGSAAYVASPLWPLERTAADINVDMLNFAGRTRDIGSIPGSERSDLYAVATEAARGMNLQIAKPWIDLVGSEFRVDQFSFAKAGVPAFTVAWGSDYIDDPKGSTARSNAYWDRYHEVTDEYDPSWDLSGMVQQAQFALNLGLRVANATSRPAWKSGAELQRVSDPVAPLATVPFYLRGTMNDWGATQQMQPAGEQRWATTIELPAGKHRFKFGSEDWQAIDLGGYLDAIVKLGQAAPLAAVGEDLQMQTEHAGRFRFVIDASDAAKPTVMVTALRQR